MILWSREIYLEKLRGGGAWSPALRPFISVLYWNSLGLRRNCSFAGFNLKILYSTNLAIRNTCLSHSPTVRTRFQCLVLGCWFHKLLHSLRYRELPDRALGVLLRPCLQCYLGTGLLWWCWHDLHRGWVTALCSLQASATCLFSLPDYSNCMTFQNCFLKIIWGH